MSRIVLNLITLQIEMIESLPPLHTSHFNRCLFTGSSAIAPILTFACLTIVPITFIYFVIVVLLYMKYRQPWTNTNIFLIILESYLIIVSGYEELKAAWSDPGIFPRERNFTEVEKYVNRHNVVMHSMNLGTNRSTLQTKLWGCLFRCKLLHEILLYL